MLQVLLAHGADLYAADNAGVTPLMLACRHAHREVVEVGGGCIFFACSWLHNCTIGLVVVYMHQPALRGLLHSAPYVAMYL